MSVPATTAVTATRIREILTSPIIRWIALLALCAAYLQGGFDSLQLRAFPGRTGLDLGGRICRSQARCSSMLLFSRRLTLGTPDSAYLLPLVLYACCLAPLLPSIGSGTVARIEQSKLLDGVTLYMTFRQLGAAFGVALVTIVLDWRETLHSARLFDHLRTASVRTEAWLHTASSIVTARGGYSPLESRHTAMHLLAKAAERQAAILAYADAFLFMAAVGVVALCLVPVIPPTPVARK